MQTAKVFKSGNSQAVRLPKEFLIDENEFYIQKIGNTIMLISKKDPWSSFRKSLTMFSDDIFSDGREQPVFQERETF
jgi:antitoxin VapB